MNDAAKLCSKEGCPVATTGKCALQRDPVESCEFYGGNDLGQADEILVEQAESKKVALTEICSSDVLSLEELRQFSRRHKVKTVCIIGEQKAGKTTLIAALYASFCKGPFAGLEFAASRTLVGFAKRHHLALLNSKRLNPTTPRTSRKDGVGFFHLALSPGRGQRAINLIISDRSGEAYSDARTDTSLLEDLEELHICERVCFVLDSEKLAKLDQRTAYSREFKQMIHALLDNEALTNVSAIEVVVTKTDTTRTKNGRSLAEKFLREFEESLKLEFSAKGIEIECFRICALPKSDISIGYLGLEELIARWTKPSLLPSLELSALGDVSRQIDRLAARRETT